MATDIVASGGAKVISAFQLARSAGRGQGSVISMYPARCQTTLHE